MSEPLPQGQDDADHSAGDSNHAWVDIASALESVSPPAEEESSGRVSMLSDVREALKTQILEHLYQQVLEELGPPEAMVNHVLSTYAAEIGDTLEEAREVFAAQLKQRVRQGTRKELGNAERMAREIASEVDPEQLAPIRAGAVARLQQQVLDDAVRELRRQVLGGETDLVETMLGSAQTAPTPPSARGRTPAPEPTEDPFESWTSSLDEEKAAAPSSRSPRELRVKARCSTEVIKEKQDSSSSVLKRTLSFMPEQMQSGIQEGLSIGSEHELKVLARHLGRRCHKALSPYADDFLANQVNVDDQSMPELLVLDTLYHLPEENVADFRAEAGRLSRQFEDIGFQIEISEHEGVSL